MRSYGGGVPPPSPPGSPRGARPPWLTRALSLAAAGALLGGCGVVEDVTARFSQEEDTTPPVVTIGVAVPYDGTLLVPARGAEAAVRLAVDDHRDLVPGWDVEVVTVDTAQRLDRALDDVDRVLADELSVAGVITGLTTADVRTVVPELDDDGILAISPADVDPRHTVGAIPGSPSRPWKAYWAAAVHPAPAEAAAAEALVRDRVRRVLVLADESPEALASAAATTDALEVRGGRGKQVSLPLTSQLVGAVEALLTGQAVPDPPKAKRGKQDDEESQDQLDDSSENGADVVPADTPALAASTLPTRFQGVMLAGSPEFVAVAEGTVRALYPEMPVATWASSRPRAARSVSPTGLEGVLVPEAGPDPAAGLDELAARLSATGVSVPPGPFGPAAYDATVMLMEGLAQCLPAAAPGLTPSRAACAPAVGVSAVDGLTGTLAFDEFGARLSTLAPMGRIEAGRWVSIG